jgi:hypothetical protein
MTNNQKLIWAENPKDFATSVNKALNDGWRVVPHTHVAIWENVATGSRFSHKKSSSGYFAMVVENPS